MAKQNRTKLKGYFETGDVPNQSNYADLIDSQLNLEDTSIDPQHIKSGISSSGTALISGSITTYNDVTACNADNAR